MRAVGQPSRPLSHEAPVSASAFTLNLPTAHGTNDPLNAFQAKQVRHVVVVPELALRRHLVKDETSNLELLLVDRASCSQTSLLAVASRPLVLPKVTLQ